jgi:tetratricopeptide (TPR) repeat protein
VAGRRRGAARAARIGPVGRRPAARVDLANGSGRATGLYAGTPGPRRAGIASRADGRGGGGPGPAYGRRSCLGSAVSTLSLAVNELYAAARARCADGDREAGLRFARRILELDDDHAGAHNLLGLAALREGDGADAIAHFRTAIDALEPRLRWRDGQLDPAEPAHRDYLEAQANVAAWLRSEGDHAAAGALGDRVLGWCPEDPLGLAASVAEDWLRAGDVVRAGIAAERVPAGDEAALTVAAAALADDRPSDAARSVLGALGVNRLVIPVILDEVFFGVEGDAALLDELRAGLRYAGRAADLWHPAGPAGAWLRGVWFADETQAWRRALDDALAAGDAVRIGVLRSEARVGRVVAALAAGGFGASTGAARSAAAIPPAGASIVDVRHRLLPDDADVPATLRRLVAYERQIVEIGSAWGLPQRLDSTLRCRRRPGRRPCGGHLAIRCFDEAILWGCTRCADCGELRRWRGTPWDRGTDPPEPGELVVPIAPSSHAALLALQPPEVRRPALRARYGTDAFELQGSADELRALADAASGIGRFDLAVPLLSAVVALDDGAPAD